MEWVLFVLGVICGVVGARIRQERPPWVSSLKKWHWLLAILLSIFVLYGSIFAYDSFKEGEARAAWFFILLHWGLAILIAFLAIGIERRRTGKVALKVTGE